MARFEGPTTEVGWIEDPQEIGKDLDPPKVTYRYAEKQAARFHDSPTLYMTRSRDYPARKRSRKRASKR